MIYNLLLLYAIKLMIWVISDRSCWSTLPPLVGPRGHQSVGSGTYYGQWSCWTPDSQYRVSKSHLSSVPTRSGSHKVMNSDGCDLSAATLESASWFHRSLELNADKLVHWVVAHLWLDRWSAWPDSAEEPLRGRWRYPRTPSRPYPSVVVVRRGPVWRS